MSVKECRRAFTVSPLLISCYTCISSWMSEGDRQKLYKMSDEKIWAAIQDHDVKQSQDDSPYTTLFAVGPNVLLKAVEELC